MGLRRARRPTPAQLRALRHVRDDGAYLRPPGIARRTWDACWGAGWITDRWLPDGRVGMRYARVLTAEGARTLEEAEARG